MLPVRRPGELRITLPADSATASGATAPSGVKPVGLSASRGVMRVDSLPELLAARERLAALLARVDVYASASADDDILIVEGVNVLQTGRLPRDGKAVPVVSDFFDFSVYIDADESVLRNWYVRRFLALRDTAFTDPRSYFHRYALLSDEEATATALAIWERTNLANLEDNILPTRPRATLILKKGADHVVETVALRRL